MILSTAFNLSQFKFKFIYFTSIAIQAYLAYTCINHAPCLLPGEKSESRTGSSRDWTRDFWKSNFWYQKILTIFWYQEIHLLISNIHFLISGIRILDIRKSFTFLDIRNSIYWYIRKSFFDVKKSIFWYQMIYFLISKKYRWFSDIKKYIFWISNINFLISGIQILDIRNSNSWYQKIIW